MFINSNSLRLALFGFSLDHNQPLISKALMVMVIIGAGLGMAGCSYGVLIATGNSKWLLQHGLLTRIQYDARRAAANPEWDKAWKTYLEENAVPPAQTEIFTSHGLVVRWPVEVCQIPADQWPGYIRGLQGDPIYFHYYVEQMTTVQGQLTYRWKQHLFHYKEHFSAVYRGDVTVWNEHVFGHVPYINGGRPQFSPDTINALMDFPHIRYATHIPTDSMHFAMLEGLANCPSVLWLL